MEKFQYHWVAFSFSAEHSFPQETISGAELLLPLILAKGPSIIKENRSTLQASFRTLCVCVSKNTARSYSLGFIHRKRFKTKFQILDLMCCLERIWLDQRICIKIQLTLWYTLATYLVYKRILEAAYIFGSIHFRVIFYIATHRYLSVIVCLKFVPFI